MLNLLSNLIRRKPETAARRTFVPGVETLENRSLLSVSNLFFSGNRLVVQSNNAATNVEVRTSGANIRINDVSTNRSWTYAASRIGSVEFQGGAGNDRFVNYVANLAVRAFGKAGNDYLEGYNGNDELVGGAGNDTLVGYGGNDKLWGEAGNDVLRGMDGNDALYGGDGNDRLNGGNGVDVMFGQNGNDILIALDNKTGDTVDGGAGSDALWVDRDGFFFTTNDKLQNTSGDKLQYVNSFANGADRTLNGDRIADPQAKSGATYKAVAGNQLFSSAGPKASDIRQGGVGDCWLLAGLGAIALDSPNTLRQNVVDFDDGTYGVALGGKFYRVDNDLAHTGNSLTYAKLGAENSMWVAVVEKAYAHYRTGANSYASIDGGWSIEVNRAFGSTSAGEKSIQSYGNATNLVNDLYARWNNYQAVTIGFLSQKPGSASVPLVMQHMYTVMSFVRNSAGVITGVVVRNPWGTDGGGNNDGNNDGLVTVTPAQLFTINGSVNWGRV